MARKPGIGAQKVNLTTSQRAQVQTALSRAQAKAKKAGRPLTRAQIATQRKKLEDTQKRRGAKGKK